ncbi:MAG: asparagine synthase-related protein [Planctomycetota bacterium]|jgi:asparagine synthase (glutamine-hydrolysing)
MLRRNRKRQVTARKPMPMTAGWTGATTPGRCCGITRGELLIAPADSLSVLGEDALARCVGGTLDSPHCVNLICGDHLALLFAQEGFHELGPSPFLGHFSFTEGLWPEPLGLRATFSSDPLDTVWTIESDHYGLRPIYYGLDSRHRPIVSTRPDAVAALIDGRLSAQAVAECLVVGFTLQSHSLFEGVRRLRPQERLIHNSLRGFCVACKHRQLEVPDEEPANEEHAAEIWISALAPKIVDAFDRGAALELSGGVDSRLVLALGLQAGAKPKLAFTLGRDADEDVRIARSICAQHGIDHRALPVEINAAHLAEDGFSFVRRAGFSVNACSYAWLPGVFEKLAATRTAQIGGGGGECASGFYYSPLDALCRARSMQSLWVHRRLFKSGVTLAETFGPKRGAELNPEITDEALRLLRWTDGSWRRRTDELYLTQRVPNAGGAVLSASACWYEPLQPLLHEPYIEWGRALETDQRADRRVQMQIVHQLDAELGAIPYSSNRRFASSPRQKLARRLRTVQSAAGRIRSRLRNERRVPDLGATSVARALAHDEQVVDALDSLARRDELNLDREHVQRMIDDPDAHEHELGALVSAAWAARSAQEIAGELDGPSLREAA